MSNDTKTLKPCPFCGAGETQIVPNGRIWLGMKYGEPTSVSVRHFCTPVEGQPSRMIERVGRDEASAIEAWNRRAESEELSAAQAERDKLSAMLDHRNDEAAEKERMLLAEIKTLEEATKVCGTGAGCTCKLTKIGDLEERLEHSEQNLMCAMQRQRDLRDWLIGQGILRGVFVKSKNGLPDSTCWVLQGPVFGIGGRSCDGYGNTPDEAIDAALAKSGEKSSA